MIHTRSAVRLLLVLATLFGVAGCAGGGAGMMGSAPSPGGFPAEMNGSGGGY